MQAQISAHLPMQGLGPCTICDVTVRTIKYSAAKMLKTYTLMRKIDENVTARQDGNKTAKKRKTNETNKNKQTTAITKNERKMR